jgi:hypothetical protein
MSLRPPNPGRLSRSCRGHKRASSLPVNDRYSLPIPVVRRVVLERPESTHHGRIARRRGMTTLMQAARPLNCSEGGPKVNRPAHVPGEVGFHSVIRDPIPRFETSQGFCGSRGFLPAARDRFAAGGRPFHEQPSDTFSLLNPEPPGKEPLDDLAWPLASQAARRRPLGRGGKVSNTAPRIAKGGGGGRTRSPWTGQAGTPARWINDGGLRSV